MKKWIPTVGKYFWHFNARLRPVYEVYMHYDKCFYNIGNCFRTKKQCSEAIGKIKKMLKEGREI